MPAHFCGIFGFKPSSVRCSKIGMYSALMGQDGVPGCPGPMANSAADLSLCWSIWAERLPLLDSAVPSVTREPYPSGKKRLTIGYYSYDGFFEAHPACIRAVNESVAALRKAGHTLVPFAPPEVETGLHLWIGLVIADGGETYNQVLEGEEVDISVRLLVLISRLPLSLRWVALKTLSAIGMKRYANFALCYYKKSMSEYWTWQTRKNEYRQKYISAVRKAGCDLLLCPAQGLPVHIITIYRHNISIYIHIILLCIDALLYPTKTSNVYLEVAFCHK